MAKRSRAVKAGRTAARYLATLRIAVTPVRLKALNRFSVHQKVPSSVTKRTQPTKSGLTEQSVALHAPRRPKCPHSVGGSKHPRGSALYRGPPTSTRPGGTLVLPHAGSQVFWGFPHRRSNTSGLACIGNPTSKFARWALIQVVLHALCESEDGSSCCGSSTGRI
jgi:hypothetical protein